MHWWRMMEISEFYYHMQDEKAPDKEQSSKIYSQQGGRPERKGLEGMNLYFVLEQ